jgi:hypothetical protein
VNDEENAPEFLFKQGLLQWENVKFGYPDKALIFQGLSFAMQGGFGPIFASRAFGYASVYLIEIVVLFATLIALAPLVRVTLFNPQTKSNTAPMGLIDFPN